VPAVLEGARVVISDKPEELEAQASKLEAEARELVQLGGAKSNVGYVADQKMRAAARLRERAAKLRKRRTDGVRFG